MKTPPRRKKPRRIHLKCQGTVSLNVFVGTKNANITPVESLFSNSALISKREARRLAKWLIQFADWAESREKRKP